MPGTRPHHTDKWRSCVEKVMAQGKDEQSASAICTASLQEAGEEIYVAEAMRSLHLRGALGAVRTELWDGREHLVVPMVALMEGVIHAVNAPHAEYVSASALCASVDKWAGHPIVVGHPTRDGKQISAHDPAVLAKHGVGFIRSSSMKGNRLVHETLIDPERLVALKQEALLADLRAGKGCEVSVGAFVETNGRSSSFNGKPYDGEWTAIGPDHTALLPGGRGACSLEMGCGAHRAAERYLVTAESFETLDSDGWTAEEGHNAETHGGSMATSDAGRKAETASTKSESKAAASYHAMKVKELQDKRVASKAHEDAVEAHLHAVETGKAGDFMKANIASDRAHAIEAKAKTTKTRNAEEAPMNIKDRLSFFFRSLMPRGWGDDEVKQELRDALLAVEPASRNGEIVRVTNDKVVYVLYPPNVPADPYTAPMAAMTYWSRGYTFDNATKKFNVDAARTQVEPTTVYEPMRAAEEKEPKAAAKGKSCAVCDGTGQIKTDDKQTDCPSCDGNGFTAAEVNSGTSATITGEQTMTKEERASMITALAACNCSGHKGNLKALEAMSDETIAALNVAMVTNRKAEDDLKAEANETKTKAEADVKAAEAKLKAAEARQTEIDAKLAAMQPIVAEHDARIAAEKTDLVTKLVTASKAQTKEQLEARSIDDLRMLAAFAKVETVDYTGRGLAQPRAAASGEDFTPPKPYEAGIKALQSAKVN